MKFKDLQVGSKFSSKNYRSNLLYKFSNNDDCNVYIILDDGTMDKENVLYVRSDEEVEIVNTHIGIFTINKEYVNKYIFAFKNKNKDNIDKFTNNEFETAIYCKNGDWIKWIKTSVDVANTKSISKAYIDLSSVPLDFIRDVILPMVNDSKESDKFEFFSSVSNKCYDARTIANIIEKILICIGNFELQASSNGWSFSDIKCIQPKPNKEMRK